MTAPGPAVTDLLRDLAARGVELAVEGNRLRYRPREAVTELLAARLKEHKADVLYLRRSTQGYSLTELAVLAEAGLAPSDVPAITAAKAVFGDIGGATVVGFESKPGTLTPDALTPDMREMYEERAGIMEYDGEMPRWRAERLALRNMPAWMSSVNATPDNSSGGA